MQLTGVSVALCLLAHERLLLEVTMPAVAVYWLWQHDDGQFARAVLAASTLVAEAVVRCSSHDLVCLELRLQRLYVLPQSRYGVLLCMNHRPQVLDVCSWRIEE